ncbi:hypothetical protein V512_010405 [Mesotoga sp. Brook.08.105.5.1]|jgi:hypothetical protein|nr:hypothetical protein V512_010405 [Mesotoga sp. Brook.08.105.5.1]RAO98261.1 hypothetical protein M388_00080 [Mesotoga sp. Brook.08.YT.4.2.5.4.]
MNRYSSRFQLPKSDVKDFDKVKVFLISSERAPGTFVDICERLCLIL